MCGWFGGHIIIVLFKKKAQLIQKDLWVDIGLSG
jgi:hypothetical protein